jgi:hypothetical protein
MSAPRSPLPTQPTIVTPDLGMPPLLNFSKLQTKGEFMADLKIKSRESKVEGKMAARPPLPPFTKETAILKVQLAEDAWNSRDAQKVALAYTIDSQWRNRAEFPNGRQEIIQFLTRKWAKELDYRLIKELWGLHGKPHCRALRVRMAR